jgi:hypothetical protein
VNRALEIVSRIEKLGGWLAVDADGAIRFRLPKDNPESKALLQAARAEKQNLLAYLRMKHTREQGLGTGELAFCGSPDCAGCYDLGDGTKIHPPRCGENFLRWRAWLEGKGPRQ